MNRLLLLVWALTRTTLKLTTDRDVDVAKTPLIDELRSSVSFRAETKRAARSTPSQNESERERNRIAQHLAVKCAIPLKIDGWNGWKTTRWVKMFQRTYQVGEYLNNPLEETGLVDERTLQAMRQSLALDGAVSEHFKYREFRTRLGRGNSYRPTDVSTTNWVVRVERNLVFILENIRAQLNVSSAVEIGIIIISAYRDDWWNLFVGGARFSQHRKGLAADFSKRLGVTRKMATDAGATGIGVAKSTQTCSHVDARNGLFGALVEWLYKNQ